MDERQVVESFHLALMTVLAERGRDAFVLKGGASLRFFLKSVRYSEDVDIDVPTMEQWRFTEKIKAAVESESLKRLLALLGTEMTQGYRKDSSATKEDWPFELTHSDLPVSARTRLEVSYRESNYPDDASFADKPADEIVAPYARSLRAPLIRRYRIDVAMSQKVRALYGRKETQPRDVFDLDFLFRGWPDRPSDLDEAEIGAAIDRAYSISFGEYASKVVAMLDPAIASLYKEEATWGDMQQRVIDTLAGLPT
jgi:predicted nucleotidyltransferase component of viral defense system